MKYLYGLCLLSLILEVFSADLNLCLLTSVDSNSHIVLDSCDFQETTLLSDKISPIYHVINKRDISSVTNTTTNITNSMITPDKEVTTQIITNEHKGNITSTPNTTTVEESTSEYDPDSGNNSVQVDGLNTTLTTVDHHRYYKSYLKQGDEIKPYWVDFEHMEGNVIIASEMLSSSYRRALTVPLSFNFPFYGHILDNITIATGGFLFTGAFLHKWLAATQYIAPLMANFDTSTSKNAMVKYVDNGTSLTVQWENVLLQDNKEVGAFTFQVTINAVGYIIFVYKDVPMTISLIKDNKHPVKVGLSDAYIVDKTIFYLRKKTIYEYHKIDMKKGFSISDQTAIVFQPLPNCVQFKSCNSCLTMVTSFKCEWCQQVGRCSDGLDRHRQDWIEGACLEKSATNVAQCANLPLFIPTKRPHIVTKSAHVLNAIVEDKNSKGHSGGLVISLIILVLVAGMISWVSYAYYHPQTKSGQMLIKYRPSTWSWRASGAKYTAATMNSIHI